MDSSRRTNEQRNRYFWPFWTNDDDAVYSDDHDDDSDDIDDGESNDADEYDDNGDDWLIDNWFSPYSHLEVLVTENKLLLS